MTLRHILDIYRNVNKKRLQENIFKTSFGRCLKDNIFNASFRCLKDI